MTEDSMGRTWLALLGLFLVVCCAAVAAQEGADFSGRWEGLLIFSPAETEVEFTVDFQRSPQGSLTGRLEVPGLRVSAPLQNVQVRGMVLSFEMHDEQGVRFFTGTLADGVIQGKCVRPNGTIPFELTRPGKNGSRKGPALEVLTRGAQLQPVFNKDRDRVRLVLLLSPT